MYTKSKLRQQSKLQREKLWYPTSFLASWQNFLQTLHLKYKPIVAAYYPLTSEADCLDIINWLHKNFFKVLLPVIKKDTNYLMFNEWNPHTRYLKNSYGIYEIDNCDFARPNIIIAPLLAFDKQGNRLGFGAGWYDKTLAYYTKNNWHTIYVGLGYNFQEVEKIPKSTYDVPLQAVLTENKVVVYAL